MLKFQGALNGIVKGTYVRRLFAPVDIGSIVFFRITFGLLMIWEVWLYFDNNWIKVAWIDPIFHFTYWGFDWIRPWPGDGMYVLFIILGVLAACITLGLWYRICITLFSLGTTYVFLLDQAMYLNHFYLICLISILMIFIPANRALSIDSWRRPEMRSNNAPAWALWLLRAQIGIVYFYGGLAKLNYDWLHGQPMMMFLSRRTDLLPLIGQGVSIELVGYLASYFGLLIDLLVVPLLLWRRTRWFAFVAVVVFHLLNAWLFHIGIFPWLMIAATLLFFPPDWPRFGGRLWPILKYEKYAHTITNHFKRGQRITVVLIGIYLVVQLLFPLRHFLYPGRAIWTEEGVFFAWHMVLRDKLTMMKFSASDPVSNKTWLLDPRLYLSYRQLRAMSFSPDLILQFSHYLANKFHLEGYKDIEIRAGVITSLNGRRPQYLIDPTVNLAAQPRTLMPARWIMPLVEPLPKNLQQAQKNQDPFRLVKP